MSVTNGSSIATITWPESNFTGKAVGTCQGFFVTNGGPVVGGLSFNGEFAVVTAGTDGTFTCDMYQDSTTTSTINWNSGFAQLQLTGYAISAKNNKFLDCNSPVGSTNLYGSILYASGVGIDFEGNTVAYSNATTAPGYHGIAAFTNFQNQNPGSFVNNNGATGIGVPSGIGFIGNGRVYWDQYEPAPLILDLDPTSSLIRVNPGIVLPQGNYPVPLEVYEESPINTGWVPQLYLGGAPSPGIQYWYQNGTYRRVGDMVWVHCVLIIGTNLGSGTGIATVVGLPYPANSNLPVRLTVHAFANFPGQPFEPLVVAFGSSLVIASSEYGSQYLGALVGSANYTEANFTPGNPGGTYLEFSGWYAV